LHDSKQLDAATRQALDAVIRERATAVGIGQASVAEIESLNIYHASKLAMVRAIENLATRPDFLLIDALALDLPIAQQAIIKGDAQCQSIAAASIVAKVHRDNLMAALDGQYPGYGLANHKGYGTPEHRAALERLGATPLHRRTFLPVAQLSLFAEAGA
jgi:ribonuclease HII